MTDLNYQVFLPGTVAKERTSFAVQLGEKSQDIEHLYASHKVSSCAFLTAYNPNGQASDPIDNLRLQSDLFSYLADLGLTWFDGASIASSASRDNQVPCALVMGIGLREAQFAAQQFNQPYFVFTDEDAVPNLVRAKATTSLPSSDDEASVLEGVLRSNGSERRDLLALARMYGVEAASIDGLIRLITTVSGVRLARPDLVPAVFGSPWQRLGEQLEHIYADKPDDFVLEVGHHDAATLGSRSFNLSASFSVGDVRNRFERRRAPRTPRSD